MDEAFEDALRLVEAVVFASAEPVSLPTLAAVVPEPPGAQAVLDALQDRCATRGVRLVEVAGGWQFRTAPELAPQLERVLHRPRRIPRAAMEALAIIAQYQPVTRAEVEALRGATLGQATMDLLLELGLIAPMGQREAPGRPALWGTTPGFLVHFGLRSLRDLPGPIDVTVGPLAGAPPDPEGRSGPEEAATTD